MSVKNLKFPVLAIYIWINNDYRNARTDQDMVKLYFNWISVSETTKNKIKAIAYRNSANALYQELTGKSYQSIIFV